MCLWLNVVVPDTAQQIFFSAHPPPNSPLSGFVLSHYWLGLIPSPLKGSLWSTDSHLFSISGSLASPLAGPDVKYQLCDRWTQTVTPVPESLWAQWDEGATRDGLRPKGYNQLSLLHSGTQTQIRHQRTETDHYPGSSVRLLVYISRIQLQWQ